MKFWIILLILFIWLLLYVLVLLIGLGIVESGRRRSIKKWGIENEDFRFKKWEVIFYVSAFFIGIPILFFIAIFTE